jgi:organic hydroperoxide reductase OsmC/OhrA
MQKYPHYYRVTAAGGATGDVTLESPNLPTLATAAPTEFGGPGDRWSPETLLAGAVADCFILTFRAVARASKLSWSALRCEVSGTLDRVGSTPRFTEFSLHVRLEVPAGVDEQDALRTLERAERSCLITQSLTGRSHLDATVATMDAGG